MLDAASLESINQEARSCFLYEDAPEYLAAFENRLQQLMLDTSPSPAGQEVYNSLMRTAHSLKGGAGIAQLPHLQSLSHKMEDLLEALSSGRVQDVQQAHTLLIEGIERTNQLIAGAIRGGESGEAEVAGGMNIIQVLEQFLNALPLELEEETVTSDIAPNLFLIQTALTVDLEECIERVEASFVQDKLADAVPVFIEECSLLGEALNLPWLSEMVCPLQGECGSGDVEALKAVVQTTLAKIRDRREQILSNPASANGAASPAPIEIAADFIPSRESTLDETVVIATNSNGPLREGLVAEELVEEEEGIEEVEALISTTNAPTPPLSEKASSLVDTPVRESASDREAAAPGINLRMPVSRLDKINNILGELLIFHERLGSQHYQLQQANQTLELRTQQLTPLNERISGIYDRLSSPVSAPAVYSSPFVRQPRLQNSTPEFDSLELDRYTELHSTLQDFQELMVRVQETRSDIDVIQLDVGESLESLRRELDGLRTELNQSRLSPFRTLADRFFQPLQSLNHQYDKSVTLAIEGGDVLVDLAIQEQLQAPLTQLFRNAFAHGIETPEERMADGKPAEATIILSATLQSNRVIFSISDDGRGINRQAVLEKAIQQGLCSADAASRLTPKQIYDFLFASGFSTATQTTALAGRGVGLDIVKLQVERLRGIVEVESTPGFGATFTLSVPLSSNILPLLICRCQQHLLAIPSMAVLEVISLQEYQDLGLREGDRILWQKQSLEVKPLLQLLPYAEPPAMTRDIPIALVVNMGGTAIALGVDALESERELVLKPFDATVPMPAYLSGCTVLGDGRVVPVLDPDRFESLWGKSSQASQSAPDRGKSPEVPVETPDDSSDEQPTILIADDSIAVRRALNRLLTQSGYRVVEGRDGKEALNIFASGGQTFDMVITDIEMPRLDGFSFLQAIRECNSEIPVAMLTSRENDRHRQKAFGLGATEYFSKPYQPRELLQRLEILLQKDGV